MNIKIHSIKFDADAKLLNFIESKLYKLLQFHDGIINAEVFLKLENAGDKENKITEVRLELPGSPVFAKKQSSTFEESTDNVVDALRRQLQKHKEKYKRA